MWSLVAVPSLSLVPSLSSHDNKNPFPHRKASSSVVAVEVEVRGGCHYGCLVRTCWSYRFSSTKDWSFHVYFLKNLTSNQCSFSLDWRAHGWNHVALTSFCRTAGKIEQSVLGTLLQALGYSDSSMSFGKLWVFQEFGQFISTVQFPFALFSDIFIKFSIISVACSFNPGRFTLSINYSCFLALSYLIPRNHIFLITLPWVCPFWVVSSWGQLQMLRAFLCRFLKHGYAFHSSLAHAWEWTAGVCGKTVLFLPGAAGRSLESMNSALAPVSPWLSLHLLANLPTLTFLPLLPQHIGSRILLWFGSVPHGHCPEHLSVLTYWLSFGWKTQHCIFPINFAYFCVLISKHVYSAATVLSPGDL